MTSFRKKGEWQNTRQVLKKVSETLLSHRSNFCSIEVIMMAKQLLLLNKKFNKIFWWSSLVSLRNNPIRCRCWQDHHLNWPTLKILQLLYWIFCKQKVVTSVHVTTLSHSSQTNSLNNRGGLVNFHCLAKRAVINISIEIESRDPWLESYFFALSPRLHYFFASFPKARVCKLNQHRKLTWASLTHVWSSSWTLLPLIQLLLHGQDRPTYL